MHAAYAVEFKSTNPDFNVFINKRDIEAALLENYGITLENETDWVEYAINDVFDGYIIDEEYVFLKSPKCSAATIDIPDIGAPVYFIKHFC
jgi:hypothetical protein